MTTTFEQLGLRPEIVMEKLALRSPFRPVREETWQAVSEAMQRGVALSIEYHRPGGASEGPRVVRPYSFVLSGRDWMMLAEDQAAGVPEKMPDRRRARGRRANLKRSRSGASPRSQPPVQARRSEGCHVGVEAHS